MNVAKIETAFTILKKIREELKDWEEEGLDEIPTEDVISVIELLRLFIELKTKTK